MRDRLISELVDHLFRHQAGRLTSALTRVFGAENLDLAEDVTQEALIKTLRNWTIRWVPDDPAAWLYRVARNAALDALRRRTTVRTHEPEIVDLFEARLDDACEHYFSGEIVDDQLRMMFTSCHTSILPDARIALTLKTVGGFSVEEIAGAFLARPTTIAQRLVRAKSTIRKLEIPFAVPGPNELTERLGSVLGVFYLMFNEGYHAQRGENLVREDLCIEATRLAELVADHAVTGVPQSHALVALMRLQGSRLASRIDGNGDLLLLADQDRTTWNVEWIERGLRYLEAAADGDHLTSYRIGKVAAALTCRNAPACTALTCKRTMDPISLANERWGREAPKLPGKSSAKPCGFARGYSCHLDLGGIIHGSIQWRRKRSAAGAASQPQLCRHRI